MINQTAPDPETEEPKERNANPSTHPQSLRTKNHPLRRLIPRINLIRPRLDLFLLLNQCATRTEVSCRTITHPGSLDSEALAQFAAFEHEEDPGEAGVA